MVAVRAAVSGHRRRRRGDEDPFCGRHSRGRDRGTVGAPYGRLVAGGPARRVGRRRRRIALGLPRDDRARIRDSVPHRPAHRTGCRVREHPAHRRRLSRADARAARASGGDRQRRERRRDRGVEDRRRPRREQRGDAHARDRHRRRSDSRRAPLPGGDRQRRRARPHRDRVRRAALRVRWTRSLRGCGLREGGGPGRAEALRPGGRRATTSSDGQSRARTRPFKQWRRSGGGSVRRSRPS